MKVDLEAPDRTRKRDREECSSGNDKESRNTDPVHIKKHKISARYSWSLRLVHWLLARSYLAHIVCLFLLLGERADRDVNPPINPAFIYAQGVIAFLASSGLASGVLVTLSVFSIACCHLSIACVFLYNKSLAYPRWLRTRTSLRSLLCAGIHLRLIGHSSSISSRFYFTWLPNLYDQLSRLGLCFASIALALLSLTGFSPALITLDHDFQRIEAGAAADSFLTTLVGWLPAGARMIASILLGVASLAYALPVLIRLPGKVNESSISDNNALNTGKNWQVKVS